MKLGLLATVTVLAGTVAAFPEVEGNALVGRGPGSGARPPGEAPNSTETSSHASASKVATAADEPSISVVSTVPSGTIATPTPTPSAAGRVGIAALPVLLAALVLVLV